MITLLGKHRRWIIVPRAFQKLRDKTETSNKTWPLKQIYFIEEIIR